MSSTYNAKYCVRGAKGQSDQARAVQPVSPARLRECETELATAVILSFCSFHVDVGDSRRLGRTCPRLNGPLVLLSTTADRACPGLQGLSDCRLGTRQPW